MIADATVTEILARIFGLYMLAAGVGLALNSADLAKMLEEMRQSRFAFYLGGLIAFAMAFLAAAGGGVTSLKTTIAMTTADAKKAMAGAKKIGAGFRSAGK